MTFEIPEFAKFPPFYTVQPVDKTKNRQLQLWSQLVLKYCEYIKKPIMKQSEFNKLPIFNNEELHRLLVNRIKMNVLGALSEIGIELVKEFMVSNKQIVDLNKSNKLIILYKPLIEWGKELYEYGNCRGLIGRSGTFFSIENDEDSVFYQLDDELLIEGFNAVKEQGKMKLAESKGQYGVFWLK
ncbi:vacuolar protein-sorting-associated protein, putative [Entamoeba dispar SAW760]|uniref:Vacuolar protein-sorting-associated protein, putative n=1 Tax=Entamoeba dispar (strain ATCC PRA-260 / SAW760) TaxID=370354 RepID=B0EPK6_ENTDS|nr:vacuolar protein-sorting-associated protein, putative [Entamoeba dispar SAW760]EDR23543.1 vacuolar protein-sorting-associated protein, putative [Entamoeba dispar SAW760]|eukprot:EDR23543.1 vacuolar protein-sorting-associated protein, putative [Entamoeba dispar SAW760]